MNYPKRTVDKKYMGYIKALYSDSAAPEPRRTTRRKNVKRRANLEATTQIKLVAWIKEQAWEVHSIPNEGKRSRWMGERMKAMGLRPGASDLFLCEMVYPHGGFYIELKEPGKKPSKNQQEFLETMRKKGYRADWFDDYHKAKKAISDYMAGKKMVMW